MKLWTIQTTEFSDILQKNGYMECYIRLSQ